MAAPALFAPQSEDAIKRALLAQKQAARGRTEAEFDLALDYIENRQIEDTRAQLQLRYSKTQTAAAGQTIEPVTIALSERYVAEAATAYNRGVERVLVDENGEENDFTRRQTLAYNRHLEQIGYDEKLHALDRIVVAIRTCGLWYQAKRGRLRPVITPPQWLYPIPPASALNMDPADQDDYIGHVVSLAHDIEDVSSANERSYVFLSPAEHRYFTGLSPYEPAKFVDTVQNPFRWEQKADTPDGRGRDGVWPLQMLTYWHAKLPIGQLIIDTDPDVVHFNRELNVQLSVLMDTLRVQGWSSLIMNVLDPEAPPPMHAYGSRFALALGPGETANFINAPNNYDGMVAALQSIVRLVAVAKRQSPNDFSTETVSAASGFAKLVDALPKIEARQERITRLKAMEEQKAWPRECAVMQYLGILDAGAEKLRKRVKFPGVDLPLAVSERVQAEEHDLKYNLTTPAKLLAKRDGISVDEAQAIIDDNTEKSRASAPPAQQPQDLQQGGADALRRGMLASIVRGRGQPPARDQNA